MADERTRVREQYREAGPAGTYEALLRERAEFRQRQEEATIVIDPDDRPFEQNRQGLIRYYLEPHAYPNVPVREWIVFEHEIRIHSGSHRHQGGFIIFVIDGAGYSIVDGERFDWRAGDLLLLPIRKGGVEHQHFNVNKETPARWIAFYYASLQDYLAMDMTQGQSAPEFRPS